MEDGIFLVVQTSHLGQVTLTPQFPVTAGETKTRSDCLTWFILLRALCSWPCYDVGTGPSCSISGLCSPCVQPEVATNHPSLLVCLFVYFVVFVTT